MLPSQISISSHDDLIELTIGVKPVPLFAKVMLILLALVFLLVPVILIASVVDKCHPRQLIPVALLGFAGFWFVRLLLWNSYGREVFIFGNNEVRYYCDFRYFQRRSQTLPGENREIVFATIHGEEISGELLDQLESPNEEGYLVFRNESGTILSQILIRAGEFDGLVTQIADTFSRR